MLSGVSIFILVGLFFGVSVDGVDGRSRAWLLFRLMGLMGGRGLGYLVGRLIFFRECEFSLFLPPPPHWEGFGSKKGLKRLPRALSRAQRSGWKARRVSCRGTRRVARLLQAVARLLQAALGGARGGWEERHIGAAESPCGALRCGQWREHRHRRREARGLVIAGQGTVDGRSEGVVQCTA